MTFCRELQTAACVDGCLWTTHTRPHPDRNITSKATLSSKPCTLVCKVDRSCHIMSQLFPPDLHFVQGCREFCILDKTAIVPLPLSQTSVEGWGRGNQINRHELTMPCPSQPPGAFLMTPAAKNGDTRDKADDCSCGASLHTLQPFPLL